MTAVRTSLYQAMITWSPPVNNDPVVLGYEVFYDLPNGARISEETNGRIFLFSSLDPKSSYPVFVVAYGGDLPSDCSIETIEQGKLIIIINVL